MSDESMAGGGKNGSASPRGHGGRHGRSGSSGSLDAGAANATSTNGTDKKEKDKEKIRLTRIHQACISCGLKKQKCTGDNPCSPCVQQGVACVYKEAKKRGPPKGTKRVRKTDSAAPLAATKAGNENSSASPRSTAVVRPRGATNGSASSDAARRAVPSGTGKGLRHADVSIGADGMVNGSSHQIYDLNGLNDHGGNSTVNDHDLLGDSPPFSAFDDGSNVTNPGAGAGIGIGTGTGDQRPFDFDVIVARASGDRAEARGLLSPPVTSFFPASSSQDPSASSNAQRFPSDTSSAYKHAAMSNYNPLSSNNHSQLHSHASVAPTEMQFDSSGQSFFSSISRPIHQSQMQGATPSYLDPSLRDSSVHPNGSVAEYAAASALRLYSNNSGSNASTSTMPSSSGWPLAMHTDAQQTQHRTSAASQLQAQEDRFRQPSLPSSTPYLQHSRELPSPAQTGTGTPSPRSVGNAPLQSNNAGNGRYSSNGASLLSSHRDTQRARSGSRRDSSRDREREREREKERERDRDRDRDRERDRERARERERERERGRERERERDLDRYDSEDRSDDYLNGRSGTAQPGSRSQGYGGRGDYATGREASAAASARGRGYSQSQGLDGITEHYRGATSGIPSLHAQRTSSSDEYALRDGMEGSRKRVRSSSYSNNGPLGTASAVGERWPYSARSPAPPSERGPKAEMDVMMPYGRAGDNFADERDHFTLAPIRVPNVLASANLDSGPHIPKGLFDRLITYYFAISHHSCPIIYKPDVDLGTIERQLPPVLLDGMCCLAARFLETDDLVTFFPQLKGAGSERHRTAREQIEQHYYDRARKQIQDDDYRSDITTVQALLLLSKRDNGSGRMLHCWQLVGSATRMVIDLGLHRKAALMCKSKETTYGHIETRRRVFWQAYIMDKHAAASLGRPVFLREEDIDVLLPSEVATDEFERWVGHYPYHRSGQPNPENRAISTHNAFARLSIILQSIINDVYSTRARKNHFEISPTSGELLCYVVLRELYAQLCAWKNALPSHLQWTPGGDAPPPLPHHLLLHAFYQTCLLLVFRPVVPVSNHVAFPNNHEIPRPHDMCTRAADSVMQIMDVYEQTYGLQKVPSSTAVYYIFTAATIYVGNSSSSNPRVAAQASSNLDKCIRLLDHLSDACAGASQHRQILLDITTLGSTKLKSRDDAEDLLSSRVPDPSSVKSSSPKRSPGAQSASADVVQPNRASPNGKSKRSGSLVKDPREQQVQTPAQQQPSTSSQGQKEQDARAQSQLSVETQSAKRPKASPGQSQAPLPAPQAAVAQAAQNSATSLAPTPAPVQPSMDAIPQSQQRAASQQQQQQLLQQQSILHQMSPAHSAHQALQPHGVSASTLQTQPSHQQQQVQQQQYGQMDLNGLLPPNNFGLATWADLLRLQQQQPQNFQAQQQQQQQNLFSNPFAVTSSGVGLGSTTSMPHRSPSETFLPIDAARLQAPPAPSFMAQQYAQLASNNSLLSGMGGTSQTQTHTPILDFSTLQPASNGNLTMANQADLAFWREMPIGCADLSDWDSFTNSYAHQLLTSFGNYPSSSNTNGGT